MSVYKYPALHFFYEDNFIRTRRLGFGKKINDNVRKFKDKPRLIFGLKSKNGMVENKIFRFFILYTKRIEKTEKLKKKPISNKSLKNKAHKANDASS